MTGISSNPPSVPRQEQGPQQATRWRDRGAIGRIVFLPNAAVNTAMKAVSWTANKLTHPVTLATIAGGALLGAGANNGWFENRVLDDRMPFIGGTNPLQLAGDAINTAGSTVGSVAARGSAIAAETATSISNSFQIPENARGFAQWYRGPRAASPEA